MHPGSCIRDMNYMYTTRSHGSGVRGIKNATHNPGSGIRAWKITTHWHESGIKDKHVHIELWKYHHEQTRMYMLSPWSSVWVINRTIRRTRGGIQDLNTGTDKPGSDMTGRQTILHVAMEVASVTWNIQHAALEAVSGTWRIQYATLEASSGTWTIRHAALHVASGTWALRHTALEVVSWRMKNTTYDCYHWKQHHGPKHSGTLSRMWRRVPCTYPDFWVPLEVFTQKLSPRRRVRNISISATSPFSCLASEISGERGKTALTRKNSERKSEGAGRQQ